MEKVDLRKKELLNALRESMGNVSHACKKCEITRQYFYKLCREDEVFENEYKNILEEMKDYAESKLFELITNLNPAAIMFFLKTKARDRGYSEKLEVVSEGQPLRQIFDEINSQAKRITFGETIKR